MRTEERERDVEDISGEGVRNGLRKMKKRKALGPNDIPVEAWIALEQWFSTFLLERNPIKHSSDSKNPCAIIQLFYAKKHRLI